MDSAKRRMKDMEKEISRVKLQLRESQATEVELGRRVQEVGLTLQGDDLDCQCQKVSKKIEEVTKLQHILNELILEEHTSSNPDVKSQFKVQESITETIPAWKGLDEVEGPAKAPLMQDAPPMLKQLDDHQMAMSLQQQLLLQQQQQLLKIQQQDVLHQQQLQNQREQHQQHLYNQQQLHIQQQQQQQQQQRQQQKKLEQQQRQELEHKNLIHDGVYCDGCHVKPIRGIRYKCSICKDFDLCPSCRTLGKHAHHSMDAITTPKQAIHRGVYCDGCDVKPIRGIRYKCKKCFSYDLCSSCKASGKHAKHQMEAITTPIVSEESSFERLLTKFNKSD